MSNTKHYKVICPDLNLILLIRKLSVREEKLAYGAIKNKIKSLGNPITIESYIIHIINFFNSFLIIDRISKIPIL